PDLHAGIHLGEDMMQEIVAQVNGLRPDLIVQTGDMIDISRSYIPPYVRAFRELSAPLGVVTVLGNHDRYTGERDGIRGCRDAGQVLVQNGCHVIERNGGTRAREVLSGARAGRTRHRRHAEPRALHRWPTLRLPGPAKRLRIFVAEGAPAGDHPRAAAIASHAPSSASITPAWVSGHSLADTRSITSVTTPSHTPAHTSAAPAFTEPSAFPCAIRLSRPRRKSRAVLRLSSSSRSSWRWM